MVDGNGSYAVAAIVLGAFGITMPLAPFVGGMVVALGCSLAVMAVRPLEKRKSLASTLFLGGLMAIMAAMLSGASSEVWLWGRLPIQAQMGFAAALSQAVFEFIAARGRPALDEIAKRAGLPGAEGE